MTRMRNKTRQAEDNSAFLHHEPSVDLESLSDEELEALLFEEDSGSDKSSAVNLPTVAGLSLIVVGMVYIFQHLGMWNGLDVSQLITFLPWLAGILIILVGLGVLSWRPRKKAKVRPRRARRETRRGRSEVLEEAEVRVEGRKRLVKSRDKKITGVCAGIADYFNIDPTLIRIAFVIGTLVTSGSFLLAYVILSIVMPQEKAASEDRITILRD